MSILDDELVRQLLAKAWQESQPGSDNPHEEGGFVLRNADGSLRVERWPRGRQDEIDVPPHSGGKRGELSIIATFHTHPNLGSNFQQEPSLMDIQAVRNDPDLGHAGYEGEYVIAGEWIYRIQRDGEVLLIGKTKSLLSIEGANH